MSNENHVSHGLVETDMNSGEEKFVPMPIDAPLTINNLNALILFITHDPKWEHVKTVSGLTGYMDAFENFEPNGYGVDDHGRSFLQVNITVDGNDALVRVFERYTDEDSPLVASGKGLGDRVFGSALDEEEFNQFANLVLIGKSFKQSEKYYFPMLISRR